MLIGPQGSGKTIVGQALGKLLGAHYMLVSNETLVTGRFNAHKQSLLLLHSDEAFFAGDHNAAGILKDFITNSRQVIEKKGVDAIEVDNHGRLLATSEQEWVIPASLGERRFATFRLAEHRIRDLAYFGAIMTQLEDNGGYEALLYHLLHHEYEESILRTIPVTEALTEQKLHSLTPEQAWLVDTLNGGILPGDREGEGEAPAWRIYDDYINHAGKRGVRRRHAETVLGNFLKNMFKGKVTKHQVELGRTGKRIVVRRFPSLVECKAMFAETMRWNGPWDSGDKWAPDPRESDSGAIVDEPLGPGHSEPDDAVF